MLLSDDEIENFRDEFKNQENLIDALNIVELNNNDLIKSIYLIDESLPSSRGDNEKIDRIKFLLEKIKKRICSEELKEKFPNIITSIIITALSIESGLSEALIFMLLIFLTKRGINYIC